VAILSEMETMESLLCVLEEAQRIASDSNWCTPQGREALLGSPDALKNVPPLDDRRDVTHTPKNWKKPKDMPRRPLSAYNLFFKSERQRILASISEGANPRLGRSGKPVGMGFAGLARDIASKWKVLESAEKSVYEEQAKVEKLRYRQEISAWRSTQAPKQKSNKHFTSVSPTIVTSTSAVVTNLDLSAFDASNDTSQSLRRIMQDALCLTSQFRNRNEGFHWDPNSAVTLPESDKVMSMTFPVSGAMDDFSSSYGPAAVSPLLDACHAPLNDDDCWSELTGILRSEFRAHETVDDSLDDLTNFMEKMERDYL
jgi:hypothetical protein